MPSPLSNKQLLLIGASRGLGFALAEELLPTGTIGVMSSGQGSITNNENGHYEIYRGSKAALNMFMRGFAARHADDPRTLLLMAPGWVRTELGGPQARLSVEESIPTSRIRWTRKPGKRVFSIWITWAGRFRGEYEHRLCLELRLPDGELRQGPPHHRVSAEMPGLWPSHRFEDLRYPVSYPSGFACKLPSENGSKPICFIVISTDCDRILSIDKNMSDPRCHAQEDGSPVIAVTHDRAVNGSLAVVSGQGGELRRTV